MKRIPVSLCINPEILSRIDEIADKNQMSRSRVARAFLDLVKLLPPDKLQFIPSIPALLDQKGEVENAR